jgi:hypothetical protein
MKHLKKFNENISDLDEESIKDLFQDLEIDFNLGVEVNLDEDNFSKFARIIIKFYGEIPENFGTILLNYINRSEEMCGLFFESIELYGWYVSDGIITNKSDIELIFNRPMDLKSTSGVRVQSSIEIILSD